MRLLFKSLKKTTAMCLIALALGGSTSISYAQTNAGTISGNYLAARHAQYIKDWDNASSFLEQTTKLGNTEQRILDSHFLLAIGSGNFASAEKFILQEIKISDDIYPLKDTLYALKSIKEGEYKKAISYLEKLPDDGINIYVKALSLSWIYAGLNEPLQIEGALSLLPKINDTTPNPLSAVTKGLIYEFINKPALAKVAYEEAEQKMMTLRSASAIAGFYERHKETDKALEIYEQLIDLKPFYDGAYQGLARLESNTHKEFDILNIEQGIARSLFDLSSFLFEQKGYESALIYTRLSDYLSPDNSDVLLTLADIMTLHGNYDNAAFYYKKIGKDSSNFTTAQIRLAEVFEKSGDAQKAEETLSILLESWKSNSKILSYIGDLHRRNGAFEKSISYYNKAIAALPRTEEADWNLFYARAISHDQNDDWHAAEADLIKALEFSPDHPLVLNYLGYSWADRGLHLNKSFEMIERAMLLKPGNGYIIDSMGWVLYKMGHYEEAVEFLERAIALVPHDATINDHLGDAYWQVGRTIEAQYQWSKSLKLSKDDKHMISMRSKIKNGLALESMRLESTSQKLTD